MAERNIYRMRGNDEVDNNMYQVWRVLESEATI